MKEQYIKIESDGDYRAEYHFADKAMTKLHCENGPAVLEGKGFKAWYIDGKRHREDGPAIEWTDGSKSWCVNGKLHRIDGPAIERSNGSKSWWVDDKYLTEAEFNKLTRPKKDCSGQVVEVDGVSYKLVKA